jgi:hypothetical protein
VEDGRTELNVMLDEWKRTSEFGGRTEMFVEEMETL